MTSKALQIIGGLAFGITAGVAMSSVARRRSYSFRDKTVIITGGSRGLGLVMAREFAEEGARLALFARDADELKRAESELTAQGADVFVVVCDVSNREQVTGAVKSVAEHFGRIDVLINNAGSIWVGPLDNMTFEDFEQAMGVHFYGPLAASLAVIPHLRRAGGGRIVNISSIGGKIAVPHLLPYTASKFALVGFSDGLRAELRRDDIFVTTVSPGLMRTGSPPNANFKGKHRKEYAWFAIGDSLPLLSMSAQRAAREIVSACRRGTGSVVLGAPAKAAVWFNALFPEVTADFAAGANCLMPNADPAKRGRGYAGKESKSAWAPSILTKASDEASLDNNELPA